MISDKERREVVEALRYLGNGKNELLDRLADLIDRPTCRKLENDQRYWRCSRCGAFVYWDAVTDLTGVRPTNYCPNCGAEVMDDGE